ncbi:terminase large subunit [Pseudonocardia hispaniensis]|uniref:Terminase large subunit n=1 Tax=Pseudonocardia hispaniensis TaxID=904933 RepID=A0ABW1IWU3_9PSEU
MAARRTRSPRPAADLSPEVKWYLKQRGYALPRWCRPAVRTPEPRDVRGAVFDPARVDHVIAALRVLRHTQGKWAGRPLEPDAWQVAYVIAPVFGWLAPDEHGRMVRIIRNAYIDVPRKGGKTTLSAGLGLVLAFADGEPGAQVLAVAGSRDQAGNAYRPAKLICEKSPQLRKAGVQPLQAQISRPSDGSFFKAVASVGDLIHGANIHGAVVDELHVHKTPDVLDAVESGTGARDQPLVIIITTADDGRPNSVYAGKRDYIERLARGTVKNPAQYGVVFAADEADDPFAEATWRRANPGYGVSPTRAFLEDEARKAKDSPVNLARYQRLHLGIRTKQTTRYLDLGEWDRNAGMVRPDLLGGRVVYGGLDLGSTSDLTSLCWLFPADEGYDAVWRFWAPEESLPELDKRTANNASAWRKAGWLRLTSGNVTDYEVVKAQIIADLDAFAVQELAFDPWNATDLTNRLTEHGAPMVEVRQGYASLSPPLKEIKRLLKAGTAKAPLLRHGGNPVMRWMVDNLAVAMDPAGNVKPDKARSADKIDGVSALTTAMARAMHHKPARRSAYETDDLEVV